MSISFPCPECTNEIPQPSPSCPHCGRPAIFWNVRHADDTAERAALQSRYDAAKLDALSRGANLIVDDFENAVGKSVAVIARSDSDLHRLANSTRQLYGTYYQQIESELRLPDGNEWDGARELTDSLLFPNYKKQIRFAALSLDGTGLSNYGSCSLILREEMIAHRSTVFNENSVLFMERHGIKVSRTPDVPKGFIATWDERHKLCVGKLAGSIDATISPNQYSTLLLKQGKDTEPDKFVEVHIFGAITVLSMARVMVTSPQKRQRATIIRALKVKLARHGVSID
jgi:hypothetical protein